MYCVVIQIIWLCSARFGLDPLLNRWIAEKMVIDIEWTGALALNQMMNISVFSKHHTIIMKFHCIWQNVKRNCFFIDIRRNFILFWIFINSLVFFIFILFLLKSFHQTLILFSMCICTLNVTFPSDNYFFVQQFW